MKPFFPVRFFTLFLLSGATGFFTLTVRSQTAKEPPVVFSEAIRNSGPGLSTVGYPALPAEKPFLKKVNDPAPAMWEDVKIPGLPDEKEEKKPKGEKKEAKDAKEEKKTESKDIPGKDYRLTMADGKYAGWFGILRQSTAANGKQQWLLEHKYFDGLCDGHIQVVSLYGAGNFTVAAPASAKVSLLSLVCVYGTVTKAADGTVSIAPEFVRVWKQPLFTFMDYGTDHSDPKWVALRKMGDDLIYSANPDAEYYEKRLGKAGAGGGK